MHVVDKASLNKQRNRQPITNQNCVQQTYLTSNVLLFVNILDNMIFVCVGSMGVAAGHTWWVFVVVQQAQNSCGLKRLDRMESIFNRRILSLPTKGASTTHKHSFCGSFKYPHKNRRQLNHRKYGREVNL